MAIPTDFTHRADLSEWMDEPCSYEEFRDCLRDLRQVNRFTLAYRPTLAWLTRLLKPGRPTVHIVDVGSGGGDMLRRIERWADRKDIAVHLTGLDLNPYAARAAREFTENRSRIHWVTCDAFSYKPSAPVDIVLSSLFTHHLPEAELPHFIRWMEGTATMGWFVNDLHRERLPWYGFTVLSAVMRWHSFVRHDGPISIRRAFRHEDWQRYLIAADLAQERVHLETFRPARLCVSRIRT